MQKKCNPLWWIMNLAHSKNPIYQKTPALSRNCTHVPLLTIFNLMPSRWTFSQFSWQKVHLESMSSLICSTPSGTGWKITSGTLFFLFLYTKFNGKHLWNKPSVTSWFRFLSKLEQEEVRRKSLERWIRKLSMLETNSVSLSSALCSPLVAL